MLSQTRFQPHQLAEPELPLLPPSLQRSTQGSEVSLIFLEPKASEHIPFPKKATLLKEVIWANHGVPMPLFAQKAVCPLWPQMTGPH